MAQRNILVVGGSSGIGRALVEQLVAKGDHVTVWSREARGVDALPGVVFAAVDVVGGELPTGTLPERLDGLVYCPGSINLKPFRSIKPEGFREELELNVIGAVRCLQAAERAFKGSDQAAVVLFSTVAVQRGMPFHSSIAAAKGAVEGLTRALAAEWAPKVRVNAIAPSLTDTPLAEKLLNTPEKRQAGAERHPLARVGTATELASLAVYLLGTDAAFITGQVLHVDGGKSVI